MFTISKHFPSPPPAEILSMYMYETLNDVCMCMNNNNDLSGTNMLHYQATAVSVQCIHVVRGKSGVKVQQCIMNADVLTLYV